MKHRWFWWTMMKLAGGLGVRECTFTMANGRAYGLTLGPSRYTKSTQIGPTTWRLEVGEGGGGT